MRKLQQTFVWSALNQSNEPRYVDEVDVEIASVFAERENHRGKLGVELERNGMGVGHHSFSQCINREEYINAVLDVLEKRTRLRG